MAQPVFDEHPLQEYFRREHLRAYCLPIYEHLHATAETGETAEPMPGGSTHFELEAVVPEVGSPTNVQAALDNLPPLVVQAIYVSLPV